MHGFLKIESKIESKLPVKHQEYFKDLIILPPLSVRGVNMDYKSSEFSA